MKSNSQEQLAHSAETEPRSPCKTFRIISSHLVIRRREIDTRRPRFKFASASREDDHVMTWSGQVACNEEHAHPIEEIIFIAQPGPLSCWPVLGPSPPKNNRRKRTPNSAQQQSIDRQQWGHHCEHLFFFEMQPALLGWVGMGINRINAGESRNVLGLGFGMQM